LQSAWPKPHSGLKGCASTGSGNLPWFFEEKIFAAFIPFFSLTSPKKYK
jgi:hypothetical protein